jgi:photosystem II stability/assembly factor-like uncharacterized protein
MAQDFTMCVGTIGTGIWRSADGGGTWGPVREGIWSESRVYSLTGHPHNPHVLFAGTDDGIYRSQDGGKHFEHLDSPMNTRHVWKIAIDPVDSNIMFAGTRPSALFRSRDGGQHWEQLSVDLADECPAVRIPRVTSLVVDPNHHNVVWAGIEVDGVRRSLDGGDTWTTIAGDLNDPDIHDIAISPATSQVLVSTPREIFVSADTGESWHGLGVKQHFDFPYCRGLALKADNPDVLFVATGNGAMGSTGAIQRSLDSGHSWEQPPLPVPPNTPIWAFATHAAYPDTIAACSHYGELFTSHDGGASWQKVQREFSEIRALALLPN